MKKVHVIGGGLAGLAVAYFARKAGHSVTVYDKGGNRSASFISFGLMHPFVGLKGLLSEKGLEGMRESEALISIASKALDQQPLFTKGAYRVCINGFQKTMFNRWSKRLPDMVRKLSDEEIASYGYLRKDSQIYEIICARSVNMPLYLKGLRLAFEHLGGCYVEQWVEEEVFPKEDLVVYAVGHYIDHFKATSDLGVNLVKGQLLIGERPEGVDLKKSVLGKGYIGQSGNDLVVGATYEKEINDDKVDKEKAMDDIIPKLATYTNFNKPLKVHSVRVGIRVVNKAHYFPIAKQLSPREYVVSGMGSRGLLYHALIGKQIVSILQSG